MAEDEGPSQVGGPARLFAGFSFLYAVVTTILLLPLKDFFRDDPNRDAVLLWLLVPLVSSFGTWMAVRSGFAPLRGWIWFGVVATMFFSWIAAFSFGLLYLPVPVLIMAAVVSPWDKPPLPQVRAVERPLRRKARTAETVTETLADGWLWTSPAARHGREVGHWRRFLGDGLLEDVLCVVTLGLGWLIWFAFEARHGQTPAKRLVGVKVHDYKTGEIASTGSMWMREVVGKRLLPIAIGPAAVLVTGYEEAGGAFWIYGLLGAFMVLISADRRTIWDYLGGTTVRLHD